MLNDKKFLEKVYTNMVRARSMAAIYEENRQITKYVHSTSRGHEAIQLAVGLQLKPQDWVSPYYRDESILLGIGMDPYQMMLQLLAKKDDPFSGGRSYYSHPSLKDVDKPKIIHQSSATGMQAIPTTGVAHGIKYKEGRNMSNDHSVVVCSFGDGSITEGEVSEAFQMAVLHQLPILYLVQDNEWGISVSKDEMRAMDAYEFAAGFKGMKRMRTNGSDFIKSYSAVAECLQYVREERKPILLHATCPLLGHHTSGVRKEFYRDEADLKKHAKDDPIPIFEKHLLKNGFNQKQFDKLNREAIAYTKDCFDRACQAEDPDPSSVKDHIFAPTAITEENVEERSPANGREIIMVDAALYACIEIMAEDDKVLLYGQDVGRRLGGVFREAATLAERYGDDRVFNTPIQEAYIFGSTAGMSAVGLKPIVEVQFCDYIFTGVNQLITELSKSCYLSQGKYPVNAIIRVPIGAYGGGGPYHSGSHESNLTSTKGIKIVYPSNAADMKGLIKAAYHDPNPVVILEHKGLYWSKVPGTNAAKTIEPSKDYVVPIGKARTYQEASTEAKENGDTMVVVTYGMGVHWALNASKKFNGQIEIVDLRTLAPVDDEYVFERVKEHGKCLVLTEETVTNSFAQSLAGRISENCFRYLDAPVYTMGALDLPAVPINLVLEAEMLPTREKVEQKILEILNY
ncbi:MAG: tungsten formylmethanofuran dehydrogenase [Bacteroidetes bacterium]|nr:tungsten formylmethanofuran dehydrogenase [Bacteroidota bacterium]